MEKERKSIFLLLSNVVVIIIEPCRLLIVAAHRGYLAYESLDTLNANFNCWNGSVIKRDTATGAMLDGIANRYCWLAVIVLYLFIRILISSTTIELYIKAPHFSAIHFLFLLLLLCSLRSLRLFLVILLSSFAQSSIDMLFKHFEHNAIAKQ